MVGARVLVVVDAHPEGIIYRDLIPDYIQIARTLYEDDSGEVVVDVNYLNVGTEEFNLSERVWRLDKSKILLFLSNSRGTHLVLNTFNQYLANSFIT